MTREKDFGHKSLGAEYCPGYTDEHNHWNNGFLCPGRETGNIVEFCCGTEKHRYCCIEEQHAVDQADSVVQSAGVETIIPAILIGTAIGLLVVMIICILVVCYFYEYCPLYKRRTKRCHQDVDFVFYDGDATAYTNELVPRKYSKGSHSELPPTTTSSIQNEQKPLTSSCSINSPQTSTLQQNTSKNESNFTTNSTAVYANSSKARTSPSNNSSSGRKFGALLSAVGFNNSSRKCNILYRTSPNAVNGNDRVYSPSPNAVNTERDSGCFVNTSECDSRMCLCENDANAEALSEQSRSSWVVDSNIYEEIIHEAASNEEREEGT